MRQNVGDQEPAPLLCAFFTIAKYKSIEEVKARAPEAIVAHIARSNELRKKGKLLMAGALGGEPGASITTMGIFNTREDAEERSMRKATPSYSTAW